MRRFEQQKDDVEHDITVNAVTCKNMVDAIVHVRKIGGRIDTGIADSVRHQKPPPAFPMIVTLYYVDQNVIEMLCRWRKT
jgi:hypothetical protein